MRKIDYPGGTKKAVWAVHGTEPGWVFTVQCQDPHPKEAIKGLNWARSSLLPESYGYYYLHLLFR